LPRFLKSLASQSYEDVQFVFHNNASSDNTREILEDFKSSLPESKVLVRNYLFQAGGADYGMRIRWFPHESDFVCIRSSNDVMDPEYLRSCVEILDSDPNIGLAYSNGYLVYEENPTVGEYRKEIEIFTKLEDPEDSVRQCVGRYTQSFPLWGVYRRPVYEKLSSWRQTCYGLDHVLVCEASLYGSIRSTGEPMDFRVVPSKRDANQTYDEINTMWVNHHVMQGLDISQEDPLSPWDRELPFHSMLMGYLDMFRTARIRGDLKLDLIQVAKDEFIQRFSKILSLESEMFVGKTISNLPGVQKRLEICDKYLLSSRTDLHRWLWAINSTTPQYKEEVNQIILSIQ